MRVSRIWPWHLKRRRQWEGGHTSVAQQSLCQMWLPSVSAQTRHPIGPACQKPQLWSTLRRERHSVLVNSAPGSAGQLCTRSQSSGQLCAGKLWENSSHVGDQCVEPVAAMHHHIKFVPCCMSQHGVGCSSACIADGRKEYDRSRSLSVRPVIATTFFVL